VEAAQLNTAAPATRRFFPCGRFFKRITADARPGAGRPPGSITRNRTTHLPLDYMLAVMRDPEAPADRRDAMAMAALPYMHRRVGSMGKKELAEQAAKSAGASSKWGDLLLPPSPLKGWSRD
jgi:hypothetical protein